MARLYRRLVRRARRSRFIPSKSTEVSIGKVTSTGHAKHFPRFLGKVTGTGQPAAITPIGDRRLTDEGRWVSLTKPLDETGDSVKTTTPAIALTDRGIRVLRPSASANKQLFEIGRVTGTGQVAPLLRIRQVVSLGEVQPIFFFNRKVLGEPVGLGQVRTLTRVGTKGVAQQVSQGVAGHFVALLGATSRAIGKVTSQSAPKALGIQEPAPNFGRVEIFDSAVGATASDEAVGTIGSDE